MRKSNKHILTSAVFATSMLALAVASPVLAAGPTTVDLQTAAPFAILAGTPNITDAGNASSITGNVGLSPASGSGIGLQCLQVTGTIYSVDGSGPLPCRVTDAPLLVTAKNHLTAAFNDAAGRTPVTTVPTELGGTTKTAGIYDSGSTTFQISAGSGPLVLDAEGDPSAVFIFEMAADGTGLTVGPGSTVSLLNGAQACNVFWRVDTATIDSGAVFKGTILALNSITVASGANIEGRLLARNGNVTLINDTVTVPVCAAAIPPDDDDGQPEDGTGDNDSSGSTGTPGLPNTGTDTKDSRTIQWSIIAFASILTVLLVSRGIRSKQTM